MSNFKLKATHAPVKAYYETLERFGRGKFDNEGNIRKAFEDLLAKCTRPFEWMVVPEYQITRSGKNPLRVDAAVLDAFNLPRGYWEAKDEKDDLKAEMNKKFAAGYPRTNILFQAPTRAILVQDGRLTFDGEISEPEKLVDVLRLFFEWRQPHQEDWDRAVREFSDRIPEIAKGAMTLIAGERKSNPAFVQRFTAFAELCRESINPELKDEAVEEMLVQHLLTERIFRRIFDNPEFTRRNVIAAEIEKVIDSLVKRQFSRDAFLKELDPFYKAIEETAANASDYSEKQAFLNRVYERFFQGFNKKQADTHGIVYTPQPIVDFMVRSVEEVLKTEFGRSLSDKGVHILDPFVGTGNFITRVMKEIKTSSLPHKYKEELHCNEIMLLPYYIASMNIEHAYLDRVGEYEPFEGICLVDTFELAEPKQAGFEFMTEGNTERIRRQKRAPIFVVIGNPPYNMGQVSENDENKNRKYKHMDARVQESYTKASKATLRNKLSDPYVKAFRLASDRIRAGGVVAFVSNSSYVDMIAFDGMRKYLAHEFDKIYVVDLGGDVRKNPKLSGTTHNVFGIQIGVAITVLVKKTDHQSGDPGQIYYTAVGENWDKQKKYDQLNSWMELASVPWRELEPDSRNTWLTEGQRCEFNSYMLVGDRRNKNSQAGCVMFQSFSLGLASNRDAYNYNWNAAALRKNIGRAVSAYSEALARYKAIKVARPLVDEFVDAEDPRLKWTRQTKASLGRLEAASVDNAAFRVSLYRPVARRPVYFQDFWNEERYQQHRIFPTEDSELENISFCVNDIGSRSPMSVIATNRIPELHVCASSDGFQCFPFYTYDEDGTNRRENITDWALGEFRKHYGDNSVSKWNIFHYTYGLLHHPEYRTRYAANLKRELPRISMAPEFKRFAEIGAALMKLHIEYEEQAEYPLERRETGKLDWRVEKMSLSKDKTQLKYNEFLTLSGIPAEVYEYRLGNRSALEWVVDQYRVSTDARAGIVNDPNREDDPEYIVRLVGQVITVSMETVRLVRELAGLGIDQA
ncbi:MAG: type ISP restriction/modification enzyme [Terracidiphilus sp.]|jgi:predicted helicase